MIQDQWPSLLESHCSANSSVTNHLIFGILNDLLLDLYNCNVKERRRLHSRVLEVKCGIPGYKGKGDPIDCGSYRVIKLLQHAMKVVENIFE